MSVGCALLEERETLFGKKVGGSVKAWVQP